MWTMQAANVFSRLTGMLSTVGQLALLVTLPLATGLSAGPVGVMTRADEAPAAALNAFRRALRDAADELGLSPA